VSAWELAERNGSSANSESPTVESLASCGRRRLSLEALAHLGREPSTDRVEPDRCPPCAASLRSMGDPQRPEVEALEDDRLRRSHWRSRAQEVDCVGQLAGRVGRLAVAPSRDSRGRQPVDVTAELRRHEAACSGQSEAPPGRRAHAEPPPSSTVALMDRLTSGAIAAYDRAVPNSDSSISA
jgi:hypothetical protein